MARHLAERDLTLPTAAMTDVDVGVMSSALPAVAVADGVSLMTPHDEAEVRQLLRRTVTPGAIRLAFTREPNYFAAEGLAGAVDRTFVLRAGGRVEGVGRLSTHAAHRNGVVRRIGYLGELRVAPETSNSVRALRDGYALLRAGLDADRVDGCFTSIAADNVRARRVLEHGARLGLPTYTPIAQLVTSLIPVAHRFRGEGRASAQAVVDDGELTDFLERQACEAQLTPTWNEARWAALARHGIGPDDFCVVRQGGCIVGAGAVWDQRAFRQTVISGYSGGLRWARPMVSALAALGLAPCLPLPGEVLRQGSVLGATVNDVSHWATLWNALRAKAVQLGLDWIALARDASDPELPMLRRPLGGREYRTQLYDVRWADMPSWSAAWDAKPFRPEVGLL